MTAGEEGFFLTPAVLFLERTKDRAGTSEADRGGGIGWSERKGNRLVREGKKGGEEGKFEKAGEGSSRFPPDILSTFLSYNINSVL